MWRAFPRSRDTGLGPLFLTRGAQPAGVGEDSGRERRVLLPGLLRIAEGAGRIGFGVGRRNVVGRPAWVRPDQFERLGPVLGLQRQFGPLMPEPYGARMGGLGLIGNTQGCRPVTAIDRLTQQSTKPQKPGILLFGQG